MPYTEHWSCEPRPAPDRYTIVWGLSKDGAFVAGSRYSCLIFSEKDLTDALEDFIKHAARIKKVCVDLEEKLE